MNPGDFALPPDSVQNMDDKLRLERLTVLTEQLSAQYRIGNLEFIQYRDPVTMLESILIRMSRRIAYIPGDDTITIPYIAQQGLSVPATWWDAFKERHFDVLLRWFPVRHTVLQEAKVLQYEQTYEARDYLPEMELPRGAGTSEIYRWNPLTRV